MSKQKLEWSKHCTICEKLLRRQNHSDLCSYHYKIKMNRETNGYKNKKNLQNAK